MKRIFPLAITIGLLAVSMTGCGSIGRKAAQIVAKSPAVAEAVRESEAARTSAESAVSETTVPETTAAETTVPVTAAQAAVPETSISKTAAVQQTKSDRSAPASASGQIDEQTAQQIAFAAAGVNADQAVITKSFLDRDDRRKEWEIEFIAGDKEYEYDINAADGTITGSSVEPVRKPAGAPSAKPQSGSGAPSAAKPQTGPSAPSAAPSQPAPQPAAAASGEVSEARAKEIALGTFGIPAGQATFTKTKLDRDDGMRIWEIEYVSGNIEYELEINAADGRVIESSSERWDRD